MICSALAATHEAPSGIFSLEMTKEQIVTRLAFMLAGIDQDDFEQRCSDNRFEMGERDEAEKKLAKAICEIDSLPIWIEDKARLTISNLTSRIEKMKSEHSLGVAFIDHLGKAGDAARTLYEKTVGVSGRIADMAKDCDVPVVTLCQLNREAESKDRKLDRRPRLSDARDAGAIEQDARVMIGLYRDDYYSDMDESFTPIYPEANGLLQAYILKSNERKAGRMIPLEIDQTSRRLRDWPAYREDELRRDK
jgi:replicative DNA helicase